MCIFSDVVKHVPYPHLFPFLSHLRVFLKSVWISLILLLMTSLGMIILKAPFCIWNKLIKWIIFQKPELPLFLQEKIVLVLCLLEFYTFIKCWKINFFFNLGMVVYQKWVFLLWKIVDNIILNGYWSRFPCCLITKFILPSCRDFKFVNTCGST